MPEQTGQIQARALSPRSTREKENNRVVRVMSSLLATVTSNNLLDLLRRAGNGGDREADTEN